MRGPKYILLAFLFAFSALALPSKAAGQATTVDYGPALLDIYVPPSAADAPVLFYVHGGAWRTGSREQVQAKPAFFNDLGMIFVSVDYRLLPEAPVTTQRDDVAAALKWVKANISRFGGDANRITMMGHSAGAHLAALVALEGTAGSVAGLISNDTGAYDLAYFNEIITAKSGKWTRSAFPDPRLWDGLSPINYSRNTNSMPIMVMWSRVRGHAEISKRFIGALDGYHQVSSFNGSQLSHTAINRQIGTRRGTDLNRAIAQFLTQHNLR